ncbi:MAG: nucleotide sugar dehydrogenase [Alphaproteobacteria bacterium]|nr:nucleotide sugar dehydrogenase [Alphaproteobacteria bacterium]
MIIGIIGLGYVGLTLALVAASKGITVYGIEIDEHIKDLLKQNKSHFYEKGINELLQTHNNKTFHVVENFPKNVPFDAFIVTVGTPLTQSDAKTPNFDYILSAVSSLKGIYDGSQMVILRSTVSVGTTRNFVLPLLEKMSSKNKEDILVGMCPERTIEGRALVELTSLPQIISGNNIGSINAAKTLFSKITPNIVIADSLEEAELAKLYCNVYRDMTFAIGNAFCLAAQSFGIDGVKVIDRANEGYPRSNIAKPGFVRGPCLEKDAHILLNNMPECLSKHLILSARQLNESIENLVCSWVKKTIGPADSHGFITLSGMAFKGNPETSDLRGSSAVCIAQKLASAGYKLYLHDFVVNPEDLQKLNVGQAVSADKLFEACAQSKGLLILNNHQRYASLNPKDLLSLNKDFHILDIWNICRNRCTHHNILIDTIGTMNIKEK